MKQEAEKAVETVGYIVAVAYTGQTLITSAQAKGLLQDLVVVVSLVRTLTESFGSASDLYRKLKRKSGKRDSGDEDDEYHIQRSLHRRRRDSMFGADKRKEDYNDSEEELICTSSSQIRAEYERGYRKLGEPFARGDGMFLFRFMRSDIDVT
jgi:hypothetical protein